MALSRESSKCAERKDNLVVTFFAFFLFLSHSSPLPQQQTPAAPPPPPRMADPSLSAPVSKALARLQQALDAGAAYEGQQVAKAAAARMRSRGSKEEAADLLGRAAEAQLRAGQVRAERVVDVLLLRNKKNRERGEGVEKRARRRSIDRSIVRERQRPSDRSAISFKKKKKNFNPRSPAAASSPPTCSRTTTRTPSSSQETSRPTPLA